MSLNQWKTRLRSRLARPVLPDFLIVGAQKAGTSSLYAYLARHPRVAVPLTYTRGDAGAAAAKEVHYFDLHYSQGVEWYGNHFPRRMPPWAYRLAGRQPFLAGEASPYYLYHPHVPSRIKALLPGVRLIVLLRNPVERTYSHYQHEVRQKAESLSFEAALDAEPERLRDEAAKLRADATYYSYNHQHYSYVARSRYAEQIEAWLDHFDRRQFLFLRSEDLFSRPRETLDRVVQFLGLEPFDSGSDFPVENGNSYRPLEARICARLEEAFRPHNQRLAEMLGAEFTWPVAAAAISRAA